MAINKRNWLIPGLVVFVAGLVFLGVIRYASEIQISPSASKEIVNMKSLQDLGFPSFQGIDLQGQSHSSDSWAGKPLILNFWATWCAPCVEEIPSLVKLAQRYGDQLSIVLVSQDSNKDEIAVFLRAFPDLEKTRIVVIWDSSRAIGQKFSVDRLPETYVFGSDRKLLRKVVGTMDWATPDVFGFFDQELRSGKGSSKAAP